MARKRSRADREAEKRSQPDQQAPAGPWTAQAVPRYNKARKRLSTAVKTELNKVQAQILQDPYRGDRKKGALRNVWVEKFKAENDQFLLAYTIDEKKREVVFYDIGQHENYYRDLTRYLQQMIKSEGRQR